MPLPTEDEIQRMHRYFAVECNNQAWELADLAGRTGQQKQDMLRLAEVAAWHWSKVGKPINFARADMLLGWVSCIVGCSGDARGHTDAVRTQLKAEPEGVSEWDHAFLVLLEAHTRLTEGGHTAFDTASSELDSARGKLVHEEEQELFDRYRSDMHS